MEDDTTQDVANRLSLVQYIEFTTRIYASSEIDDTEPGCLIVQAKYRNIDIRKNIDMNYHFYLLYFFYGYVYIMRQSSTEKIVFFN